MFNLVKEIKNQAGELHFRRWSIVETRFFNIYIHRIYKSDEDPDPHSHPWWFLSFLLRGSYWEQSVDIRKKGPPGKLRRTFSLGACNRYTFHKITLKSPDALSLVITGPRFKEAWGYWGKNINKLDFNHGQVGFIDHEEYRRQRQELKQGNPHYGS